MQRMVIVMKGEYIIRHFMKEERKQCKTHILVRKVLQNRYPSFLGGNYFYEIQI